MTEVGIHDLEACGDVFDWLTEQADSLTVEQSITMLDAAQAVKAKLLEAISMLEAQALNLIEQPVLVGSTAYSKKPSIKKRPQQSLIAARVADKAAHPDGNGEVPTAHEAATAATNLMRALYVSPSTMPKYGGIAQLGLSMDDVTREERTGWELKRTELD